MGIGSAVGLNWGRGIVEKSQYLSLPSLKTETQDRR